MDTGVLIAWAGVVVAAAGSAAAFLSLMPAKRAADAARAQTELQRQLAQEAAQPMVWADVRGNQHNGQTIELVVGNSGPTTATNVRVAITPPLPGKTNDGQHETCQQQLRRGLSSLAPGRELRWLLFVAAEWKKLLPEGAHTVHHFTIDANGPNGPVSTFEYDIDLADMIHSLAIPTGTLHDLSERLKRIEARMPDPKQPLPVRVTTPPDERPGKRPETVG
ncbi:MAG: hypothetical protein LBE08_00240 [Bifidobacteriaceae bacterium]|jgi:hypothetical protein|nr:hypothetical protein [Bifidobacteriaceae bacterium]